MMNQREAMIEVAEGRIRPVYLVYGGEAFLESELLRALRDAIVRPETEAFNYHVIDYRADQLTQALSTAQTMPFFDQRRLVIVRDCPAFMPPRRKQDADQEGEEKETGMEGLLAYLQRPVDTTCLVFTMENVDNRKKTTKAAMALGGAVECKPLKDVDAVLWAQERATRYGKKMSGEAARILVEKVGTDLRSLDSDLSKLALFAEGAREITVTHVQQAVSGTAETEIYKLTEAVMLKQRSQAIQYLASVLRQVDHPLQVLAAITNQFRLLLLIQALVRRGVSLKEGPGLAKIHPYRYQVLSRQVMKFSRPELVGALERLLETDIAMKSGHDPRLALEAVVVELMASAG